MRAQARRKARKAKLEEERAVVIAKQEEIEERLAAAGGALIAFGSERVFAPSLLRLRPRVESATFVSKEAEPQQ